MAFTITNSFTAPVTSYIELTFHAKAAGDPRIVPVLRGESGCKISAIFDLSNGTVSDPTTTVLAPSIQWGTPTVSITDVGSGWYKCFIAGIVDTAYDQIVFNHSGTNYNIDLSVDNGTTTEFNGDNNSGVYLWETKITYGSISTGITEVLTPAPMTASIGAIDQILVGEFAFPPSLLLTTGTAALTPTVAGATGDDHTVMLGAPSKATTTFNNPTGRTVGQNLFSNPFVQIDDFANNSVLSPTWTSSVSGTGNAANVAAIGANAFDCMSGTFTFVIEVDCPMGRASPTVVWGLSNLLLPPANNGWFNSTFYFVINKDNTIMATMLKSGTSQADLNLGLQTTTRVRIACSLQDNMLIASANGGTPVKARISSPRVAWNFQSLCAAPWGGTNLTVTPGAMTPRSYAVYPFAYADLQKLSNTNYDFTQEANSTGFQITTANGLAFGPALTIAPSLAVVTAVSATNAIGRDVQESSNLTAVTSTSATGGFTSYDIKTILGSGAATTATGGFTKRDVTISLGSATALMNVNGISAVNASLILTPVTGTMATGSFTCGITLAQLGAVPAGRTSTNNLTPTVNGADNHSITLTGSAATATSYGFAAVNRSGKTILVGVSAITATAPVNLSVGRAVGSMLAVTSATSAIGSQKVTNGFLFSSLIVTARPDITHDVNVSLKWSDDRGATWGEPVEKTLGQGGEYITNLQWQRLGYGRDRVFSLEWSAPTATSLNGVFYSVALGQT